jgi:type II secretory pathway component PulJ
MMDAKKAAQLDRAARQTLETVELRKAQGRINRERREREQRMAITEPARAEILQRIKDIDAELARVEGEYERAEADARALYASLRRMANGMHSGDYEDAKGALDEASALLGELGDRYEGGSA